MDLIKTMLQNRKSAGMTPTIKGTNTIAVVPSDERNSLRAMKRNIIEKKPGKKVIKEYFEAVVEQLCESSSDEED
jgi:hypothetical protein